MTTNVWLKQVSVPQDPQPTRHLLQGRPLVATGLQVTGPCLCAQEWTDYRLAWNSSRYEGVNILRVPAKRVWLPDIVLYNKLVAGLAGAARARPGQRARPWGPSGPEASPGPHLCLAQTSRRSGWKRDWAESAPSMTGGELEAQRREESLTRSFGLSWAQGQRLGPRSSALSGLQPILSALGCSVSAGCWQRKYLGWWRERESRVPSKSRNQVQVLTGRLPRFPTLKESLNFSEPRFPHL